MYRTASYLGHGIGFPFRLNRRSGGVQTTTGSFDSVSVALQYIASESWTIREPIVQDVANHVAEAVYNILFTSQLEHETLPEYGSRIFYALFEPNTVEFRLVFETYLKHSTYRWEKRARFPDTKEAVQWFATGTATDRGELPLSARVEFITQQTPKNLVAPFVDVRQARLQEYPAPKIDYNGHDNFSRYYNKTSYLYNGLQYTRLFMHPDIPEAPDDTFYQVKPKDTWMLISYFTLDDIRSWEYIFRCYLRDKATEGLTRDIMNPNIEPEPGTILRIPSRERVAILNSRK